MERRRLRIVIAAAATIVLAACSSSTSGRPSTSIGAQAGSTTGALVALLQRGLKSIRSAHISFDVVAGGRSITGRGDETLVAGKLSALDLSETIPGVGVVQVILVEGKTFAKFPGSLNHFGKPYVLVSTNSSNPTIKSLAKALDSAQSSASIGDVGVFVGAATSVKVDGSKSVHGIRTTHYSVVVDPSKLPSTFPGKSALIQAGVRTLPVELYLDSGGRPIQATEKITASGQKIVTRILVSNYNKPVTIAAPPADQVSTG